MYEQSPGAHDHTQETEVVLLPSDMSDEQLIEGVRAANIAWFDAVWADDQVSANVLYQEAEELLSEISKRQ